MRCLAPFCCSHLMPLVVGRTLGYGHEGTGPVDCRTTSLEGTTIR
ncbi:hypothetical protein JOC55_005788 [Paenibacillus sacheonensis]|nr:hypothetical protein [Paenibacillus sacheonensis]